MAIILSGRDLSDKMKQDYKKEIEQIKQKHNIVPGRAVILIGDNPASLSYVKLKEKACTEVGIVSHDLRFNADYKEEELLKLIQDLNSNNNIHGILVQLPLLLRNNIEIEGKHVVIIGRSNIVGKPLAMILIQKKPGANATVTLCHTRTKNIAEIARTADILVAAVGRPHTVTKDMVKQGAVVIDVGVNRIEDKTRKRGYRLIGDVDFEEVSEKASAITPVPGGVGPMTITMLLHNTIQSAKKHAGIE
jgi:methylenetetrahydrofolate dehydrogenase (NADP+)/methenyltetrahydrofolate cyclohydrolase